MFPKQKCHRLCLFPPRPRERFPLGKTNLRYISILFAHHFIGICDRKCQGEGL